MTATAVSITTLCLVMTALIYPYTGLWAGLPAGFIKTTK